MFHIYQTKQTRCEGSKSSLLHYLG